MTNSPWTTENTARATNRAGEASRAFAVVHRNTYSHSSRLFRNDRGMSPVVVMGRSPVAPGDALAGDGPVY